MVFRVRPARRAMLVGLLLLMGLAACTSGDAPGAPAAAPSSPTPAAAWAADAAGPLILADSFAEPLDDIAFAAHLPACAVWDATRVMWLDEAGALQRSDVDDAALAAAAATVVEAGFFDLEPVYGDGLSGPVRELTFRLAAYGTHTVRVYGDIAPPPAFDALYPLCASLTQPEAIVPLRVRAGWVSVFPVEEPGDLHQQWPPEGAPADAPSLAELVEVVTWVQGDLMPPLWSAQQQDPRATWEEDGRSYIARVALPGVMPDAPPQAENVGIVRPPAFLWSLDAETPIFVLQLAGGLPTPHEDLGLNALPACVIFGDGRILVSEQPIGEVQAGYANRYTLTRFLQTWINAGFYTAADASPAGATPAPSDLVRQEVTLLLADRPVTTRAFVTGTAFRAGAPNPCLNLAELTPLVPDEGVIFFEEVGPVTRFAGDPDYALVSWPEDYPTLEALVARDGLDVTPTGDPLLVEALALVWESLHGAYIAPHVYFTQAGLAYRAEINAPAITRTYYIAQSLAALEAGQPTATPSPTAAPTATPGPTDPPTATPVDTATSTPTPAATETATATPSDEPTPAPTTDPLDAPSPDAREQPTVDPLDAPVGGEA